MRRIRLPLLLVVLLAGCTPGPERPQRIVLVTIDTLRADHVGCYGDTRARTPALDGLAEAGLRFAQAISPAPITLTSHTSLMTGREPPRHGVRDNAVFRLPDDVPTLAERFRAAGWATAAFVGSVVLDHRTGLDRGFQVYDDDMGDAQRASATGFAERPADRVVDAALAWLEHAPDHFLLWVHLYDPHADYSPPPGFRAAFPDDPYRGEIAFADSELGRLLAAVDARFHDGRTLVVATSDHGESLGEHGERTHSLTLYDATQRVPLLMRGPGIEAGRTASALAGLIDVAPTVLIMTSLPLLEGSQGRDLRSVARGSDEGGERLVYMETLATQIGFGWSPLLGLRSSRWKYVRAPRPELYDLEADPGETHNLARDEPERVRALDAALDAHLREARLAPPMVVDSARRARLEALGYVVPDAGGAPSPLALGAVGGTDPKDALPMVDTLHRATTLLAADHAAKAYELLRPLQGGGYQVDQARALAALEIGELEDAERSARRAVQEGSGFASPHSVLGFVLLRRGNLDAAEAVFARAAQLDPDGVDPLIGQGELAEARGDPARAEQLYEQAAAKPAGAAPAGWHRAALRLEAHDVAGADAILAGLPPDAARSPEAAARLALAESHAGLDDRARKRIAEAARAWPDSARVREAEAVLGGGGD